MSHSYGEICFVSVAVANRDFWVPLEISEFSPTPPHSDRVTSGRSPAESDRHSVPLSAAALPTDWGDWDPERLPISTQCLGTCSDSLETHRQTVQFHRVVTTAAAIFTSFAHVSGRIKTQYCGPIQKLSMNVLSPPEHVLIHSYIILNEVTWLHLLGFVPFWEVPSNNVWFKCIQVVQVNIFRALMLAPLPHTFVKAAEEMTVRVYSEIFSLPLNRCMWKQTLNSGPNRNHILPVHITYVELSLLSKNLEFSFPSSDWWS